jgi:hypothetical protein
MPKLHLSVRRCTAATLSVERVTFTVSGGAVTPAFVTVNEPEALVPRSRLKFAAGTALTTAYT